MKDPNCDFCNAGAPCLQGICVYCDGCFGEHCQCDPCQHGKAGYVECVFCGRLLEHPGILLAEDPNDASFTDAEVAQDIHFEALCRLSSGERSPDENQDAVERDAEEKS